MSELCSIQYLRRSALLRSVPCRAVPVTNLHIELRASRQLKTAETRFVGHLNTILQDCHSATNTPVGQHFRSVGHSHTDIQVTPFETIKTKNPFVRKAREAYLIDKHQLLTKVATTKGDEQIQVQNTHSQVYFKKVKKYLEKENKSLDKGHLLHTLRHFQSTLINSLHL